MRAFVRSLCLSAACVVIAASLARPAPAEAQDAVRVLFIPGGTVPGRLRSTLSRLLASRATMVDYAAYARAASARSMRPSSRGAIRRVATQQNANVIVVASYGGHYRRRLLRLRGREEGIPPEDHQKAEYGCEN